MSDPSNVPPANLPDSWSFSVGEWYEFTINPNDDAQFEAHSKRYQKVCSVINDFIKPVGCQYLLYPEITMPQYGRRDKNRIPRIHFHGVIRFPSVQSILNWLMYGACAAAEKGSYQFNNYRPDYWPGYCTKHADLFEHLVPDVITNLKEMLFPKNKYQKAAYYKKQNRKPIGVHDWLDMPPSDGS